MSRIPSEMTVLLTSAGVATASNVIDALQEAPDLACRIVAVDQSPFAAGLHRADAWENLPPCASPEYIDRVFDLCRREGVFFLFPLYSGEIGLFCEHAARFREIGVHLMLPPAQAVRTCNDKRLFGEFLEANGFRSPRIHEADAARVPDFPLIMKPASGSGSKNVVRIDGPADLAYFRTKFPGHILQAFVQGREYTVDCLVDQGRVLACVPRTRVVVKDGKTMVGRTEEHPGLRAATARLLAALGMNGPCNVQFIEDEGGELHVIEVNPRLAAGGLPLSVRAGANIPAMMLRLARGEAVEPVEAYRRGVVMTRYLSSLFLVETERGLEPYEP